MRQHVEGDLVRIDLACDRLALDDLVHLPLQFRDGLGAGAGHGLVAGGEDALAAERLVQRIERHQRDGRGAVRVGDDALVPLHVRRVDLRHHQRHVVVHAEGAGIVHHHAAGLGGDGRKLLRDAAAGAEQRDVDARERVLASAP